MRTVRIGTRDSRLALVQTEMVKKYIEEHSALPVELVSMKTTGDIILDKTLDKIGGKGLFMKELDAALRDGRSDLSVHSLKDVTMEVPEEFPLLGFSKREDCRDVLVLPLGAEKAGAGLNASGPDLSKPVGCSSKRRMLQFQKMYPQAVFKNVRGNVLTRLSKLDSGEYGALILAAAGLKRLGLEARISRYFEPEEMIPAAGQGIIAVQGPRDFDRSCLEGFFDREAGIAAAAERAFVRYLDGGCSSPIAAHAAVQGSRMKICGLYYDEDISQEYITGSIEGECTRAEELGRELARDLKEKLERQYGCRK